MEMWEVNVLSVASWFTSILSWQALVIESVISFKHGGLNTIKTLLYSATATSTLNRLLLLV